MITLYTTCRAFDDQFNVIQRNALYSWSLLSPKPEVLVFGMDHGTKEICKELDYQYITNIEYSSYGTPMLNSMMEQAERVASFPQLLLISSDIVLFQSVMTAAKACAERELCGTVRKQTQSNIQELDFSEGWEKLVIDGTIPASVTTGDFFLYPKNFWPKIPPFIIGRGACDSWLYYAANKKKVLLDLSEAVAIVDYVHGYDFSEHRQKEVSYNASIIRQDQIFSISYANWKMTKDFEIKEIDPKSQFFWP